MNKVCQILVAKAVPKLWGVDILTAPPHAWLKHVHYHLNTIYTRLFGAPQNYLKFGIEVAFYNIS